MVHILGTHQWYVSWFSNNIIKIVVLLDSIFFQILSVLCIYNNFLDFLEFNCKNTAWSPLSSLV